MNTPHADLTKFARFAPVAVTSPVALTLPGVDEVAEGDDEWLEFLSLGARMDSADPVGGRNWRHAPVLLSY